MSLGIVFKGPEGIVLAADSRVTLNAHLTGPEGASVLLPATFDNATKLLKIKGQDFVGTITYGAGAIGQQEPRTAHSFVPELEASLVNSQRLGVREFADKLSEFFMARWKDAGMLNPAQRGQDMSFLVGGYDKGEPYGTVFEIFIPSKPTPRETLSSGQFGATWGGQHQVVSRLINGFDLQVPKLARKFLNVSADGSPDPLLDDLKAKLQAKIPWQFLPLQDCVDLSIFLIRATISLQKWTVDIRGVGGAVDVATVTRTKGFEYVQQKMVVGEATN